MRPQRLVAVLHARGPVRRPDVAGALVLAAFFLGIVVAAAAFLGLRIAGGDTVPQREHADTLAHLAAEQAARGAQSAQLAAQGKALDDAGALARRLVAALDDPRVTAEQIAALRRDVTAQTTRIERVRVVRVPVPGPVVTVTPSAAPTSSRAEAANARPSATPSAPSETPPARCALELLGVCVTR